MKKSQKEMKRMSVYEQKKHFNEQLREMFGKHESLEEEEVRKKHPEVYDLGVATYGTWGKALALNGVKKKRLMERERFYLYFLMKERYRKFGEEALRHKNIDEETKTRIVDAYKTVKSLNVNVVGWTRDRVLYEVRKLVLTGVDINRLKEADADLYKQMIRFFKTKEKMWKEYEQRFELKKFQAVVNTLEEETTKEVEIPKPVVKEEKQEKQEKPKPKVKEKTNEKPEQKKERKAKNGKQDLEKVAEEMYEYLKEIHYFENEEVANAVKQVIEIGNISKTEVVNFVLEEMAQARKDGERLTEEKIEQKDPMMYRAFKKYYKNLREVGEEITRMMIG